VLQEQNESLTCSFVRRVLQTPVTSIMVIRNGITALTAMMKVVVLRPLQDGRLLSHAVGGRDWIGLREGEEVRRAARRGDLMP